MITSAFGIILDLSMTINGSNLGLFPIRICLLEFAHETIEFPAAMIAGALIYEGGSNTITENTEVS